MYHHHNIPIQTFQLLIDIRNQESASHAENWIKPMITKYCFKELSLSFFLYTTSVTLPDEILSSQNLTKLRVSSEPRHLPVCMKTSVINCVSLQELHLNSVHISEEALNNILSSCTLLVKIELLYSCKGFKTIKVKNLHRLYVLTISEGYNRDAYGPRSTHLEINHVPNLGVFSCNLPFQFNSRSISLGSNVRELTLDRYGMVTNKANLEIIESGFPFLESLTLSRMDSWRSESFHFTCPSIKKLTLESYWCKFIDIQVHAPKLIFFSFRGVVLPSLLFPVSILGKIIVSLLLRDVDVDFFLKLRKVLTLSRNCDIHIILSYASSLEIDDLRTRLMLPPAMNVRHLRFGVILDQCLQERIRFPFFDAFFEICHPKYVSADPPDTENTYKNHFCRMMLREVLEKKTTSAWAHYLEHVRIKKNPTQNWEALTDSHRRFLESPSAPGVDLCFNLNWR